jgi:Rrf2 family protein
MFSKSCEYGIKAMVYIAQQSLKGNRVKLNDISVAINSPTAFTAKILQLLSKKNLINSAMGASGGYLIETSLLQKITLLDIVNTIDGDAIHNGCGLGFNECNKETPCPIHFEFIKIRDTIKQMLQKNTLLKLANTLEQGEIHLKQLLIN